MFLRVVKNKNWVILMLLIFVGQVMSAPLASCQTSLSSKISTTMDMSSMPNHDMAMMHFDQSEDADMTMDCCEKDCQCSLGMCLSMVFYPNTEFELFFTSVTSLMFPSVAFIDNSSHSSIYRPPILS